MNMKLAYSTILIAALLAAGVARADTPIYKWVDEQGQVHYSTVPHSDKAQQLSIQNSAAPHAGTNVTTVPGASTNAAADDTKLVLPQSNDSPECKAARDILFKYMHADRLYKADDQGKKVSLSANEKQKAMEDARAYVKQTCVGGA
jgi:hypothetical protein